MAWLRGNGRIAGDYGLVGALVGFVVSLIVFVVMMGISLRVDRGETSSARMGCSCLLRLVALLILTFGLGVGYMIGKSMLRVG